MNYGFEIICASIFTVVCIISARFYSLINVAYTYWDKKKINGPFPRYVTGTWSGFAERFLGSDDCTNVKKYGKTVGTYDGMRPNLLVTEPQLIKEILSDSADKFYDVRSVSESSVVLKDSLLYLSGTQNPKTQSLIKSLLNSQKLKKLFPKLESTTEELIHNMTKTNPTNITTIVEDYINEVIASGVFGLELNADVQMKDQFVKNSSQILKIESPQSLLTILPFLYENYLKDSWIFPEKSLQYFVNLILQEMEKSSKAEENEEKSSTLIEIMVEAANEEKKLVQKAEENVDLVMTDNAIISKCIASILALKSLAKNTILLGIYSLANNEDVQEKLQQEVEKYKSEVSFEKIQQLSYLDKFIKEVLRLYPFEFRLERVTTDTIKLGEIELDKKTRVSIPLYALHRSEDNFPEPLKFNPDRFSEILNPYTYLPFGQAGNNGSDISYEIAILICKLAVFRLIEKVKFSSVQELGLDKLFKKGFTRIPQPENIEVLIDVKNKNLQD